MKKVNKYGTGEDIPEDAKYLTSFVEEVPNVGGYGKTRLVWHYFLVEVEP